MTVKLNQTVIKQFLQTELIFSFSGRIKAFAEASGVSHTTIYDILNGEKKSLRINTLEKILKVAGDHHDILEFIEK